ncbi:MAG: hypothetical protein WCO71_10380, partial [Pseudomonadota bacterium]
MRYLLSVTLFASLMFEAGAVNAQITLGPGQSQTITCSTAGGGGGGATQECIQQLHQHCLDRTSNGNDTCYTLATQYCPSTAYVTCVQQTQQYCQDRTSNGNDICFKSALQTCRG